MSDRFRTFDEFWPYYVREHSKPLTRKFHFVGTGAFLALAVASVRLRRPSLFLASAVAGYGPAWISHFFIEKNRPATFTYPAWSLLADFKMFGMMLRGEMDAEVARVMAAEAAKANGKTASPNDPVPANAPADPHSVN
jgi:hypothetical protein